MGPIRKPLKAVYFWHIALCSVYLLHTWEKLLFFMISLWAFYLSFTFFFSQIKYVYKQFTVFDLVPQWKWLLQMAVNADFNLVDES